MPKQKGNRNKILKRVSLTLFFCLLASSAFCQTELKIISATASSTKGLNRAPRAIDNKLSTEWKGEARKSYWWLSLDLGKSSSLSRISIWWHKNYGSTDYDIQASNDNTSWIGLYTGLSSSGSRTNPIQKDYTLTGSYRYIRLYINQAQKNYPTIYEVKLYGEAKDTTPPQITSINPADGSTFNENASIVIQPQVSDTDPSPLEYQFSIDGIIKQAWSGQTNYSWAASSGKHTLKVEVRDAGGQATKEIEIFVFRKPIPPPS